MDGNEIVDIPIVGYPDAAGNRLTKAPAGQAAINYSYDSLNRMTAAGSTSYAYDSNGNMLSATTGGQTTNLAYSTDNWLTQITYPNQATNTFAYRGGGIRFSKTDSAGTTRYVRDGGTLMAEVDGAGSLQAAYTPAVSVSRGGASRFYHSDGLGSTRHLSDAQGNITDQYAYDAFGNITSQGGSSAAPVTLQSCRRASCHPSLHPWTRLVPVRVRVVPISAERRSILARIASHSAPVARSTRA